MTSETDQKFKKIYQEKKRQIPRCNYVLFDLIWDDYTSRMKRLSQNEPEYQKLAQALIGHIKNLQRKDAQYAPPSLIMLEHESTEEYLNRCYRLWIQKTKGKTNG